MAYDRARIKARYFDRSRARYLGAAAKLLLLKVDGGAAAFTELERVTASWTADFSDFIGSVTFRVAKSDATFNGRAREASHLLVIDSNNAALNHQLHEVNRETTVPAGVDPFWRLRATQTGKRYVPA